MNILKEVFDNLKREKFILVPTVEESEGIFGELDFNEWKYGILKAEIDDAQVFLTGVSKANASFAAAMIFDAFQPKEVILTGICGAYRESGLAVGDLVSVVEEYFVDEAVMIEGELKLIGEEGFEVCENHMVRLQEVKDIKPVKGNTVSLISGEDSLSNTYYNKTGADVETMEGAAVALAAEKVGVKLSQIRGVSNFCGKRSEQEWNVKKAFSVLRNYFKK